jgi:hypothetical protein
MLELLDCRYTGGGLRTARAGRILVLNASVDRCMPFVLRREVSAWMCQDTPLTRLMDKRF